MSAKTFHKELLSLAILPLILMEVVFQLLGSENNNHYWRVFAPLLRGNTESNIIVIGSSRAATAIVPELLELESKSAGITTGAAYNLGMGYSTTAEYYFLLKKLARDNPRALKNSIVLIETTNGIAPIDTWAEPWFHRAFPLLALPFLEGADIKKVLDSPAVTNDIKLFILPAYYFALPREILMARTSLFERGADLSEYVSKILDPKSGVSDIAKVGGIRVDQINFDKQEDDCDLKAYESAQDLTLWEKTVVRDISHLLKESGATLVFFDPPLTPRQRDCLNDETARRALRIANEFYRKLSAKHVQIEQSYELDDFADAIHIRLSRADGFTLKLVDELK